MALESPPESSVNCQGSDITGYDGMRHQAADSLSPKMHRAQWEWSCVGGRVALCGGGVTLCGRRSDPVGVGVARCGRRRVLTTASPFFSLSQFSSI